MRHQAALSLATHQRRKASKENWRSGGMKISVWRPAEAKTAKWRVKLTAKTRHRGGEKYGHGGDESREWKAAAWQTETA